MDFQMWTMDKLADYLYSINKTDDPNCYYTPNLDNSYYTTGCYNKISTVINQYSSIVIGVAIGIGLFLVGISCFLYIKKNKFKFYFYNI